MLILYIVAKITKDSEICKNNYLSWN